MSWIVFTSWSVWLWKYGSPHPQRFFLPLLFLQVGWQPFTRPLWSTQKMLDVEILGLVTDNCYSISSNVCFGLVWDTLQWWSLINPQQATASATTSIKHHSCHCSINKQLVEDGDTWTLIVNYWDDMETEINCWYTTEYHKRLTESDKEQGKDFCKVRLSFLPSTSLWIPSRL